MEGEARRLRTGDGGHGGFPGVWTWEGERAGSVDGVKRGDCFFGAFPRRRHCRARTPPTPSFPPHRHFPNTVIPAKAGTHFDLAFPPFPHEKSERKSK
ncbi:hypothetical protein GLE_1741 [Lysobacter enzymogenes]|uniref:Uncharacterized protein n=1 Tax=Lysobacter enzymogenes TaxID=69 RepID=A0A0S2DFH1_LYSEN|nr:hypothetical protein GLE_1741 [Lysobacter enzymogenes]